MGHHEDGHPFLPVEPVQDLHDGVTGCRIQISRRLVGKKDLGVVDRGPGRWPPAVSLPRKGPRADAPPGGPSPSSPAVPVARRSRSSLVIFMGKRGRATFSQAESVGIRLKDWKMKPTLSRRKRASSSSVALVISFPSSMTFPAVGTLQAGEQRKERRLAAARFSHQADEFTRIDREGNILDHRRDRRISC